MKMGEKFSSELEGGRKWKQYESCQNC